jgi:hypothetical protein
MQNIHYTEYAKYEKYAYLCIICTVQNMQNMQNMQNKYFSIFLKNMLIYDEHPDGIPDSVRVFVIFSIFF